MLLAQIQADNTVGLVIAGGLAIVLIGLLIWGVKRPVVWRLLSVFGMAVGSGLLVRGIMEAAMNQEPAHASPPLLIGIGAGTLAGAITLLVISFFGGGTRKG